MVLGGFKILEGFHDFQEKRTEKKKTKQDRNAGVLHLNLAALDMRFGNRGR